MKRRVKLKFSPPKLFEVSFNTQDARGNESLFHVETIEHRAIVLLDKRTVNPLNIDTHS